MLRDVDNFADKHGMTGQADLLKKLALIAKDPANFENVEGLQEDDCQDIRDKVLDK